MMIIISEIEFSCCADDWLALYEDDIERMQLCLNISSVSEVFRVVVSEEEEEVWLDNKIFADSVCLSIDLSVSLPQATLMMILSCYIVKLWVVVVMSLWRSRQQLPSAGLTRLYALCIREREREHDDQIECEKTRGSQCSWSSRQRASKQNDSTETEPRHALQWVSSEVSNTQ